MYFNETLAKRYGLTEAILLHNFYFWIDLNKKNNRCQNDGNTWTFASVKTLSEKYSFLTTGTIRSALKNLLDLGLIIKANYNTNRYNKTTWYAFKDDAVFTEIAALFKYDIALEKKENANKCPSRQTESSEKCETKKDEFKMIMESIGLGNVVQIETEKEDIETIQQENITSSDNAKTPPICKDSASICKFNKSIKINKINNKAKNSLDNAPQNQKTQSKIVLDTQQREILKAELTKRGITKFQIYKILSRYSYDYLTQKIDQFDYISRFNPKEIDNGGRYMYMSIVDNWISEAYTNMINTRENKRKQEIEKENDKRTEKLKKDYELYLDNECKNEYLTLSEDEKTQIDIEIKRELDNSPFIRSNELVYTATLEARRVLFVMERVKGRAMGFDEFVKTR